MTWLPHAIVLGVCVSILGAALVLALPGEENGALRFFRIPLPETCSFKNLTGLPCPGCGLTRSLVAAVHGDIPSSFRYHRLGWAVLLYLLLQAVHRSGMILFPKKWPGIFGRGKVLDRGLLVLAAILGLNWVMVLIGRLAS